MLDDEQCFTAYNIDIGCKREGTLNVFTCFEKKSHSKDWIDVSFLLGRHDKATGLVNGCTFRAENEQTILDGIQFLTERFPLFPHIVSNEPKIANMAKNKHAQERVCPIDWFDNPGFTCTITNEHTKNGECPDAGHHGSEAHHIDSTAQCVR